MLDMKLPEKNYKRNKIRKIVLLHDVIVFKERNIVGTLYSNFFLEQKTRTTSRK